MISDIFMEFSSCYTVCGTAHCLTPGEYKCSQLFLILTCSKWYFLQCVDSKDFTSMVQQNKVTKLSEINPHFSCVHYTVKLS